jgi:hypothetical protein
MKKFILAFLGLPVLILAGCAGRHPSNNSNVKDELLTLERKWLEAEFALDTSAISQMMHDSCLDVSEDGIHNKWQSLSGMYNNISQRNRDSVFVDSFRLENEMVRQYDNTAIVTFVVHSFRKNKGVANEKRTRFFDVWLKQKDGWKMIATQATPFKE